MTEPICSLMVLLFSFESLPTNEALRSFLANTYVTDQSDSLYIHDIPRLISKLRCRPSNELLSFPILQRINSAVQEQTARIDRSSINEKTFTAHQYIGRIRQLIKMVCLRNTAIVGSVVPLSILQQHGRLMNWLYPLKSLNRLLSQTPATTKLEEHIILDETYLKLFWTEIEAKKFKPNQKIGLSDLLEINKAVQTKYSAKMSRQQNR
ncbi:MAG: hypothetical protein ABIH56_02465 [Candidatus Margulisiibacteriota bacterium]